MFVCRHVRQRVTSINQLAVAYCARYHRVIVVVGGCCCVSVAATNLMKHTVLECREVVGRRHVLADLRTPCVATCYRSLNFIYIYISQSGRRNGHDATGDCVVGRVDRWTRGEGVGKGVEWDHLQRCRAVGSRPARFFN